MTDNINEAWDDSTNVKTPIPDGVGDSVSQFASSGNLAVNFVHALNNSHQDNFPLVLNGETVLTSDPDFIIQNEGKLGLLPAHAGEVYFICATAEDTTRDYWRGCQVAPTAVAWKDGKTLLCWALDNPGQADDADIAALVAAFEMGSLDIAIALPGTDGWEFEHADLNVCCAKEQLVAAYLEEPVEPEPVATPTRKTSFAEGDMYNQAKIYAPYDIEQFKDHKIVVAWNPYGESKKWKRKELTIAELIHKYFTTHPIGKKEGPALVFADMPDGQRLRERVLATYAIPVDYDTGITVEQLVTALKGQNCAWVIYSSHSHKKTRTVIKEKALVKLGGASCVIDTELCRRYLQEIKKWEESIVFTVEFIELDTFSHEVTVIHAPIQKLRAVVFLREPFILRNEADTQEEAWAKWAGIIEAFAERLGLPGLDTTCLNPHHFFYNPRHDNSRTFELGVSGGELLDWRPLVKDSAADPFADIVKEFGQKGKKSKTPGGQALGSAMNKISDGFLVKTFIEDNCDDIIVGSASSDGIAVTCPNEHQHTEPGGTGCYARDPWGDFFVFSCRHNSCLDLTKYDLLDMMIENEGIDRNAVFDPKYDGTDRGEKEPKVEIVPTLPELLDRIAGLKKAEGNADWDRNVWYPVLFAIEEARLNVTDRDKAHETLRTHCDIKKGVYKDEVSDFKRDKKNEAKSQKPKEADAKTVAKSDKIAALLKAAFGTTFHTPTSLGGRGLLLKFIDERPWFVTAYGKEIMPICSPFVFDGAATYADRNNDRALRVRVLDADDKVVPVEFEAALLGSLSGNELIGKLYAKGWVGDGPGRDFVLTHLRTKQVSGPTVYHKPGLRDGVFVLANKAVIATKSAKNTAVELHPESVLMGNLKNGNLETWKEAAHAVFNNPKAWHFQLGVLLGWFGPTIGYLDLLSLFVLLGGPSRGGKTASQRGAAAHYAEADETKEGNCFVNAKGTAASRENTNQQMSGMVLCMDEFKTLPPKEQAEFAFEIAGGSGKRRMKKDTRQQNNKNWNALCVVASAELTLGQILALAGEDFDAGMTARFLPVKFPKAVKWSAEKFAPVKIMHENYGYSGEAFIRALVERDKKELSDRLAEIVKGLLKATGKTNAALCASAAQNAALFHLVAEIAAKAGLIPENYDAGPLTLKVWKEFLASDTPPIDAIDRALDTFLTNLSQKRNREIVAYENKDTPRSVELMGFHSVPAHDNSGRTDKDKPCDHYCYVIYAKFLGQLNGGRADEAAFKKLLHERGYLVRPTGVRGKNGFTWTKYPKLDYGPWIVIRAEMVDDPADDDVAVVTVEAPAEGDVVDWSVEDPEEEGEEAETVDDGGGGT